MRVSDIFGKLPPGLPGARQSYESDLFGLGAAKRGQPIPEVIPYAPGGKYYELPAEETIPERVSTNFLDRELFGFGQEAPAQQPVPIPVGPNQGPVPHPEGEKRPYGPSWLAIGIGVAVVGGIIAYLIFGRKTAGGMGDVGKGTSKRARKFISKQTKKLIKAGLAPKRAVAAAYSMARQKHYKVGPKPR